MKNTHFDAIADVYDESLPSHVVEHYLDKRADFIRTQVPRGGSVLDVGCGTGALARRVRGAGYDVVGVDPSKGMLAALRGRAPSVDSVAASGMALPFASDRFDLVYCVAVMHHIAEEEDVRQLLAEMVRVTRSGGLVLVWDHNPRNPYWRLLMARVPQDTGDERLIPEAEILAGLRAGGARLIRSRQLGFVPDFIPARLLPLAAWGERIAERTPGLRRVCAHNVVLATKD